jgi:hypothetical protein
MRVFLKRLAIVLTAPVALMILVSAYLGATNSGSHPDYFFLGLLGVWCLLVWAVYWVLMPLFPALSGDRQAKWD